MAKPDLVLPAALPLARREAHRRIRLSGTYNLRDLGGYPAAGGRAVRWGVLYRSDHLGRLTPLGLEQVRAFGLAAVLDLRSEEERKAAPDRLPAEAPLRVVELPISYALSGSPEELGRRLKTGDVAGVDVPALMLRTYRQFATAFAPQFGRLVREVLDAGGQPVLFHCTAGKDRTGFAAALLLRLRGVSQETVLHDYGLSTRYNLGAWRWQLWLLRLFRGTAPARVARQLCAAEAPYLQAAFEAASQTYGSFDAFVLQGLGLGQADVDRLRELLLE